MLLIEWLSSFNKRSVNSCYRRFSYSSRISIGRESIYAHREKSYFRNSWEEWKRLVDFREKIWRIFSFLCLWNEWLVGSPKEFYVMLIKTSIAKSSIYIKTHEFMLWIFCIITNSLIVFVNNGWLFILQYRGMCFCFPWDMRSIISSNHTVKRFEYTSLQTNNIPLHNRYDNINRWSLNSFPNPNNCTRFTKSLLSSSSFSS